MRDEAHGEQGDEHPGEEARAVQGRARHQTIPERGGEERENNKRRRPMQGTQPMPPMGSGSV